MNGLVELRCKQERQRLRRVVEDAHRVLKHFHTREQKDELSRSTAQKFAAEILRITRYASAIAAWTYLFVVNSKESALLVHPYEEEVETSVGDGYLADLVSSLVELARTAPRGYILYYWLRYGYGVVEPKLAYYSVFEPWGWAVGSACYVVDVLKMAGQRTCSADVLSLLKSCVILEIPLKCACGAEIRPCFDAPDRIVCPCCGVRYQMRASAALGSVCPPVTVPKGPPP